MVIKNKCSIVVFVITTLLIGSVFGSGASTLNKKSYYNELENPLKFIDVTPEEANEMITADNSLVIVDIRISEEYDSGHITGAVSIPFLACSECFLQKLSKYKNEDILLYGDEVDLSRLACSSLIEDDFSNVYRLEGGIAAWVSNGFVLIESSSGNSGSSDGRSSEDIAALQRQGVEEGWTFTVGENPATGYSLDELCGLKVPDDWWVDVTFDPCTSQGSLPDTFDWRDAGGCTPVKDQGNCGSCWAFGTVAPLECNILIKDGTEEDLSEQWLVSCNRDGYGCNGGWWAHDYHQWKTDPCGDTGAVMEDDFPYVASGVPCDCPYPHEYFIDDWAFIGSEQGIPSVNSIKQAIMDYGPVSAAVRANSAMQAYTGGIFNGCDDGKVNHAVVLVGWDDNQGSEGVWFMRNSWGPDWGEEGGYMRIPYGCSSIGYSANYIDYVSSGGNKQVDIEIYKITNDPDQGDFDEIDEWWDLRGGIKPEWYYRVGVEADGDTKYQHNYNRDLDGWWIFEWISEHTWNAQQVHIFHVDDTNIEFTIKLMDDDVVSGDDLADVSAYTGGGTDDDITDKRAAIYHGIYDLATDELTGDATSDDGSYKVTLGDGINNAKVWFKITDDYEPKANLDCEGNLNWGGVPAGGTVTGSFRVKNIGDSHSKLDWEVKTWPSWGTQWSFNPKSGNDLEPEDGSVTLQVSVKAPDTPNQQYSGEIKVVNKENSNDYEIISVSLTTPRNRQSIQQSINPLFLQILGKFLNSKTKILL